MHILENLPTNNSTLKQKIEELNELIQKDINAAYYLLNWICNHGVHYHNLNLEHMCDYIKRKVK